LTGKTREQVEARAREIVASRQATVEPAQNADRRQFHVTE
jgi:hypothetical protein